MGTRLKVYLLLQYLDGGCCDNSILFVQVFLPQRSPMVSNIRVSNWLFNYLLLLLFLLKFNLFYRVNLGSYLVARNAWLTKLD